MCYVASGTTCIGYRDGHAETSLMLALYAGDCTVDELVWPPGMRCLVRSIASRRVACFRCGTLLMRENAIALLPT